GLEMEVIVFQPEIVSKSVNDFISNLIQSVILVIVVMLAFLGLRTGLVVASLIPMTILTTFWLMSIFGVGIDQISLAALIIALGMLVDNAIVMSESILVQMEEGKSGFDASVSSAKELSTPLLTSSLTTIAAFLPIYLAESNAGEYTAPLFKVVTIALCSSWLLSLVLIPLLSVNVLRPTARQPDADPFNTPFYRWYRRTLEAMVRRRWVTLGVLIGLFGISLAGVSLLPSTFFPESDRPLLTAKLNMPTGTSMQETESVVWEIEEFLASELEDEIVDWVSFMGDGGPRFVLTYNPASPSTSTGIMILNARDRDAAIAAGEKLRAFCGERFPDLVANIRPLEMGPPVGDPIGFQITGRDSDALFEVIEDLKRQLSEIPGVYGIQDDWGMQVKKLVVEIDQDRAMRSGVSSQDIAVSLQSSLSGLEATEFREGVEPIPVMLRAEEADRGDLDRLQTIQVQSQSTGRSVPLLQVADVSMAFEPSLIRRRDRTRAVKVEASLNEDVTQLDDVNAAIEAWLEKQKADWPVGMGYSVEGRDKASSEANAAIFDKLPIAAAMIVFLLVFQFNSIRRPTIVLATLPLGLIGVVSGLLIAGSYMGFMTLLGIISLMGIIINNAVVLLDRIQLEIEELGRSPADAIIEAAQRRLRPILLTTATTIMGLVPLWVSGGPMWEPMAIAIIFGLAFATVLTLGAVPVLYSIFFRVQID
ncbi:MAG: efflux RND transporter permease subunit, partial [Myxococcota bacterium]